MTAKPGKDKRTKGALPRVCLLDLRNADFMALQQDVQTESHSGLSLLKMYLKVRN